MNARNKYAFNTLNLVKKPIFRKVFVEDDSEIVSMSRYMATYKFASFPLTCPLHVFKLKCYWYFYESGNQRP